MKEQAFLHSLIEQFYLFREAQPSKQEFSLAEFGDFLKNHQQPDEVAKREISGGEEKWVEEKYESVQTDITVLISLMYRYAKMYIKKALKDSPIQTADEFGFLITLLTYPSLSKTALINKNLVEKTSGADIIKRLIKLELMEELEDKEDKRSVHVKITEKGKYLLYALLPEMQKVSTIVAGDLSNEEQQRLLNILRKLDHFHNDIFVNKRNVGLDELVGSGGIKN